jgi:SAM-dependent methyltransferase
MDSRDASRAQVEAAEAYEAFFVPALFGEWAARVADAAGVRPGDRVLDVACGTGVLARACAARTGPSGAVTGVDPNQGMLSVASGIDAAIRWRPGHAESLPFRDESFDVVASQFGLMFFADRLSAVREMLRVSVPGGRIVVAVWDALERIPAYAAEVALLERLAGPRAAEALRAPFVLGDPAASTDLFMRAGAPSVSVSTQLGTARFPSVRAMVEADVRGWLPVMGVTLPEPQIERILSDAEDVLYDYVTEDGAVVFDTRAHIVLAVRPARGTEEPCSPVAL